MSRDTFELEVVGGRMLETVWEQIPRSADLPMTEGMAVKLAPR